METNVHHHFWEARRWKAYSLSSQIRNHELSKSVMDASIHSELHAYVPPISPPTAQIARLVLNHLCELPGYYKPLDAAESIYNDLYEQAPEYSEHMGKQIPFLKLSARALARRRV